MSDPCTDEYHWSRCAMQDGCRYDLSRTPDACPTCGALFADVHYPPRFYNGLTRNRQLETEPRLVALEARSFT